VLSSPISVYRWIIVHLIALKGIFLSLQRATVGHIQNPAAFSFLCDCANSRRVEIGTFIQEHKNSSAKLIMST